MSLAYPSFIPKYVPCLLHTLRSVSNLVTLNFRVSLVTTWVPSLFTYKYISTTPVYLIVFSLNIIYPCPTSFDLCIRSSDPPSSHISCVVRSAHPLRTLVLATSNVRTPLDFVLSTSHLRTPSDFRPPCSRPFDSTSTSHYLVSPFMPVTGPANVRQSGS